MLQFTTQQYNYNITCLVCNGYIVEYEILTLTLLLHEACSLITDSSFTANTANL